MNTFAIITNDGYGTRNVNQIPHSYIVANTASDARKAFAKRYNGTSTVARGFRSTKVAGFAIEDPDMIAT